MPRSPNYGFDKRRKELERKRKQEEKRQRKADEIQRRRDELPPPDETGGLPTPPPDAQ